MHVKNDFNAEQRGDDNRQGGARGIRQKKNGEESIQTKTRIPKAYLAMGEDTRETKERQQMTTRTTTPERTIEPMQ